jgi:DNA-binding CsgD family transcriptional regulator/PAS domain-containing protein
MSSHERMLSLIRDVYTAAADEACWPAVLERLSDEFGSGVAGLQYRIGTEGHIRSARFVRVDPALLESIRTYYATRNPWTRLSQPWYRTGTVYTPERLLPLAELRRTEYYDGILRPAGVVHCFGACVFKRGDDALSFTVVRSQARGPYDESELTRVRAILPHLQRAISVNERLSQLQRSRATFADGLDQLRHGVIVVNDRGRVVFANRAARAIVAQHDGLTIAADGLTASAYADRLKLRSLLDEAVRTSAGQGFGAGGAMALTRPSLKRPFFVLVTPLPLALDSGDTSGLATVFVSDPEAQAATVEESARRLHGLTASEARVADALVAMGSLEQAGDILRISRETARSHLRSIYRKMRVNRQADLIRQLIDGPPRVMSGYDTDQMTPGVSH